MKKDNLLRVCGSILKKESIVPLKANLLENTFVAEANEPYSNYYGNVPEKPKPNSLFLFTESYYSLEEVLRFSQNAELNFMKKANVAAAVLKVQNKSFAAIRIKNFPDYKHLADLQKCLKKQGVEFSKKEIPANEALVRINKCFVLQEIEKGIYLDTVEENKGYISLSKLISETEFENAIDYIKNNSSCHLFDAAKAGIILRSQVVDFVRIYSEKLVPKLLMCIKEQMEKQMQ